MANLMDSAPERLLHYLEMAAKAHEAARRPLTEVRVRNLYVFIAKTWEMLAMDEVAKLRGASRAAGPRIGRARSHSGEESHAR